MFGLVHTRTSDRYRSAEDLFHARYLTSSAAANSENWLFPQRVIDEDGSGNERSIHDLLSGGKVLKLRDDYGAPDRPSVAGKSRSAVKRLLAGVVLNAKVRGEPVSTLPFVTSYVSATLEREDEHPADSIPGLNLRNICAPQRFVISSDSSYHSGANIAEAEVDSVVRSSAPIIATVVTATADVATTTKEAPAKEAPARSSLFVVGSSSAGGTDLVPGGFSDVSGSGFLVGGIRTVVDPEFDLQKVYVPQWSVTNGSCLDDGRVCHEMLDEFAPPKFFASIHGMEHDQLFIEFNVGAARQISLSAEVRMHAQYNIKEKRRLKAVVEEKDILLKTKSEEIDSLNAQLLLIEAEVAEAIHFRVEASRFGIVKKSLRDEVKLLKERNASLEEEKGVLDVKVADLAATVKVREQEATDSDALITTVCKLEASCAGLQEKVTTYEKFVDQLEKFQEDKIKEDNDKLEKLDADVVAMVLHLEEKFYPHLLNTISGRQWLPTHGMELVVTKFLNSTEYLSALGAAIGKAVEKGMQEGLSAGITHGIKGRTLTDIDTYNPLEDHLADRLGLTASQPRADQLMVPIHHSLDHRVIGASALPLSLDVSNFRVRKITKAIITSGFRRLQRCISLVHPPFFQISLVGTIGAKLQATAQKVQISAFSSIAVMFRLIESGTSEVSQKKKRFIIGSQRSKEDEVHKLSTSVFVTNFPDLFNAKDLWNTCKQYGNVVDDPKQKHNVNVARFLKEPLTKKSSQFNTYGDNRHNIGVDVKNRGVKGYSNSYAHIVKGSQSLHTEMENKPALVLDNSCLNQHDYSNFLMGKVLDNSCLVLEGGIRVTWVEIVGIPLKMWSENTFNRIASLWGTLLHVENQEDECKVFWVRPKEIPGWVSDFMEDDNEESDMDDAINEEESNGEDVDLKKFSASEGDNENEVVPDSMFEDELHEINGGRHWSKETWLEEKSKDDVVESMCPGHFQKAETPRSGGSILQSIDDMVKELTEKRLLWDYLSLVMENWNGEVFQYWFDMEGFDKLVEESWKAAPMADTNAKIKMMKKLKYLKEKICVWNKTNKEGTGNNMRKLKADFAELDVVIDKGEGDEDVVNKRTNVVRSLQELEKLQSMEVAQKVKIKCAIEGDENSKYYHGILNKRGDCGIDKSPSPDGFTFGFHPRYWKIIESDVVDASKKKQSLVFKVDFEKAYDLVRWDYLDDILRNFGLGDKWRVWIQNCLRSYRGSVIVNGSPTEEFQIYKGLKQGDPLSPFLFILVMESLQVSFQRVVDAGNGADTLFWEDAWRGGTSFKYLFPKVYALESSKNIVVASKMAHFRKKAKRFGSVFNVQGADAFNMFISNAGLEELLEEYWKPLPVADLQIDNQDDEKTQISKRKYSYVEQNEYGNNMRKLKADLAELDAVIDKGKGDEDVVNKRTNVDTSLQELEKLQSVEVAQKAKIKWAIEGDENSKRPTFLQLDMNFPNILNSNQQADLECEVTKDEIKRVVWDCGTDKSRGLDGFTFDFYRRYWKIIESDVVDASKKKQSLVFKVDFEKAYDLVRWDYLDDILRNFGLGDKWRVWIQNFLRFYRGSVIVNGSPTEEFQIYKGLKQGDPLSPFLFILVMESLQVSFQRVVDAGMLNGISLDPSLYLSHMFYADDAIFVGQWNESNINTIVHILDRFLRASGLRINMSKSKLLGISMDADKVGQAARKIGNGADTLFWEDAWRGGTTFKYLFPRVYALESSKNIVVASKMAHCILGYSFRRDPRGSVEKAQFDSMLEKVEGTLLADMRDRWMLSLEGSGDFSVASVRKLLDGNMLPEVASKTRWIKAMPIKVNVHAWRVKLDCLPTRINISRRGMKIESIMCPMCGEAAESCRHIFFSCHIARDFLRKISR
ncbi:putative gypsy type transposase [Tanacetum coccineum]